MAAIPFAPRALTWPARLSPQATAACLALLAMLAQVAAAWPGWLTPASAAQLQQARYGPFTDAHPAGLTWMWAQMDPVGKGPLVPFLMQTFVFWLGVAMLAIGIQPARPWTRFIPLLVLACPLSWVVAVVSPVGATLSLASAAIGLAAWALRQYRSGSGRNGSIALWLSAVVMGFGALGAGVLWFAVVPLLALLTAALAHAVVPAYVSLRGRLETVGRAVLLALLASAVAGVALPLLVIGNVGESRASEAFYALDARNIDCAPVWNTGRPNPRPVSPDGLWNGDPCASDLAAAWVGAADSATPAVLRFGDWFSLVRDQPGVVLGGRVQHASTVMRAPYQWTPDPGSGALLAAPGAVGAGEQVGAASRGGVWLSVMAAATTLLPGAPLLWAVVLPIGVALWYARRVADSRSVRVGGMLLWPPLAGIGLAMAGPFGESAAVVGVIGLLVSLYAAGVALDVRLPDCDPEVVRIGGEYPVAVRLEPMRRRRSQRFESPAAEEPLPVG